MRLDAEKGTWISLRRGLPSAVHTCVLRDAMGTPGGSSEELYFCTTTGELYRTLNEGEEWQLIASGLGRIQGVSAFYTEE